MELLACLEERGENRSCERTRKVHLLPEATSGPCPTGRSSFLHAGGPTPIHLLCHWSRSHAAASEGSNALPRRNLRLFCGGWRGGLSLPDPDRLDAVLAHGFHPDRVAVGGDRVAPFRQPAELGE